MSDHILELHRHIKATPQRVYQAWLSPADIAVWMGPTATGCTVLELNPVVGGSYKASLPAPDGKDYVVGGTFKELDEPNKIVMTWQWDTAMGDEPLVETLITVTFTEKDGGTDMHFKHEHFVSEASKNNHEQGWTPCFEKLMNLLTN